MDFALTSEQEALRDLAAQILGEQVTHERLKRLEASGDWFDRGGAGVRMERQVATSREPQGRVTLAGASGEPLARGAAALAWLLDRAVAGLCAMQLGVADRALRMTAEYTTKREQFGKPIA